MRHESLLRVASLLVRCVALSLNTHIEPIVVHDVRFFVAASVAVANALARLLADTVGFWRLESAILAIVMAASFPTGSANDGRFAVESAHARAAATRVSRLLPDATSVTSPSTDVARQDAGCIACCFE